MFLWMIVGVMAAIELVLSLSTSGIIGTDNLRWPAFMLGAFWQPVLSGALPPVYPGQTALMNQTGFTGEHKAWKVSHDKRKFREPFFDRSACARSAFGT
jgi:hypothetical protein